MKKLLLFLFFGLLAISAKSQNMLNLNESTLISKMIEYGAYNSGKKYTKEGIPFLTFQYSIDHAKVDGIIGSYYYLNEDGICDVSIIRYNDSKYLDTWVEFFKSTSNFRKVSGKFAWDNDKGGFQVQVEVNDVDHFSLIWMKYSHK